MAANKDLAIQIKGETKKANDLAIAIKARRADELLVAIKELAFQNEEKAKRADELLVANKELAFQNEEKAKRAAELIIANTELAFQNEEKAKRAAELLIANKELAFQNEEKAKRAAELLIANNELIFQRDYQKKIAGLLPGVVIQYRLRPNGTFCIPYASEAMTGMYRVSPDRIQEDASAVIEKIHPDDLAGVFTSIQTSARNLTPWQHEYRVKFKDGIIRTHCCNAVPQKEVDGSVLWHGFITDVTELSRATLALRESENKFRTVADFAYDWESWIEPDGRILYISPSCERITGYTREEFLSDRLLLKKIIHPDDAAFCYDLSERIQSPEHRYEIDAYEFRILRKDGSVAHIGHLSRPVSDDNGNYRGRRVSNRDITAKIKIKEDLELATAQLALATRVGGVGLWDYDIANDIMVWDEQMGQLYGISKRDLSGVYETWLAAIHPEDKDRVYTEIKMAIRGKQEYDTEYRIVWPDGSTRHIKAMAIVQRDHISGRALRMIGTNWDITKIRKDEQDKLDASEKRYRSVFNGGPDGIMISDAETRMIKYANRKQCEMLGYEEAELKSMTLEAIHPRDAIYDVLAEYAGLAQGKKGLAKSIQCLKKNGEIFYSDISGSLMEIDNRECIVGFFRDITDRRLVEFSLNEALVRAEAANRLKTEFMKTISHEVRTPLNGILGFGNLLSDPDLTTEERQQYGLFMEASGSRLISTISDYMDVSLIASGNIEVNSNTVNVFTILNELKAHYQSVCNMKKLDLHMSIPEGQEHCTMITDGQLLRKIISCLLDNAIKFTERGSISFGYSRNESNIEFFVADTGIGVSADAYKLVFDPFVQEDSSNSRGYEGSGLGLYIIKSFLKLLGSEMCLETVKGKGTEVSFTLPMERGFTEERNPSRRLSDRGQTASIRP